MNVQEEKQKEEEEGDKRKQYETSLGRVHLWPGSDFVTHLWELSEAKDFSTSSICKLF